MKIIVDHIIRQGQCHEICEDHADPILSGNMRLFRAGTGLVASDGGQLVSIRTRKSERHLYHGKEECHECAAAYD